MLSSYLKLALRSLMRQKLYALVQIAGLGIGLACSMLIGIHVRYELGYDRQFRHAERIFRLVWPDNACMPNPLAAVLERELPEVERAVRVQQRYRPLISHDEKRHFYRVHFADEGFFELFDYVFLYGDPHGALRAPASIVLREDVARQFFGDRDPIGQTLEWDGNHEYTVTGVVHVPEDTHLPFELMASYSTLSEHQTWEWYNVEGWRLHERVYTYLLLPAGYQRPDFGQRVLDLIEAHGGPQWRQEYEKDFGAPRLQALTDIHLRSNLRYEPQQNGRVAFVYMLAVVASDQAGHTEVAARLVQ